MQLTTAAAFSHLRKQNTDKKKTASDVRWGFGTPYTPYISKIFRGILLPRKKKHVSARICVGENAPNVPSKPFLNLQLTVTRTALSGKASTVVVVFIFPYLHLNGPSNFRTEYAVLLEYYTCCGRKSPTQNYQLLAELRSRLSSCLL